MRSARLLLLSTTVTALVITLGLSFVACQDLDDPTGQTDTTTAVTTSSEPTSTTEAQVVMPLLVGMAENQAKTSLASLGIVYEVKSAATLNSARFGKVTAQAVAEGTAIKLGTTVGFTVGRAGVEVPNVDGVPDYDADGWLQSLDLECQLIYVPAQDGVSLYTVTGQTPAAGTIVLRGSTVKVTVEPEF